MADEPFGPTGDFPRGKLRPDDEGGLNIGIAHDSDGTVIINFGTDVSWLGLPPDQAREFAKLILIHSGAKKIEITL
jgi:hypothetical protein